TACREYFKERAFYCMDRFHLAREIRRLCRKHPRYRQMQEALEATEVLCRKGDQDLRTGSQRQHPLLEK
ncbi:UPF0236 family transposase-like protein, partial [Caldalkalibacillus thermarum]|uniref:UPF0236 family transposase-like protein n=1 Tax=Caldalkalibacillus thermarum TaxID=296745 RepID=UPI00166E1F7D